MNELEGRAVPAAPRQEPTPRPGPAQISGRPEGLSEFVARAAAAFDIPGVAVGVFANGRETYSCHGVTSVENPLAVDQDTLFVVGSVTKTFTATVLMRLVADGLVDLDAPVRRYVPELRLADMRAAAQITVRNLLNHTSGLGWGILADTGDGDDALARYVGRLAETELVAPPGSRASYSQAGYSLAGRIVEKVTGVPYEHAVAAMVLEPLELTSTFFTARDVMTRRFAVGHNPAPDGSPAVARLWKRWRGDDPGAGIVTSVADLMTWAIFHLGDGRAEHGARVLPPEFLRRMRQPSVRLRGSALGDAIGIGWFLRDLDGVRTVGHGGSANGQFAELLLAPERGFAVVSLSNAGPNGIPFNQAVVRWALSACLGLQVRDPRPLPYDAVRTAELVGTYEIDAMTLEIKGRRHDGGHSDGTDCGQDAGLTLDVRIKPEIRAATAAELPPDHAPAAIGLLPGDGDEYVVVDGGLAGQRGFFSRDSGGRVVGVDLAGRLFSRVPG